MAQTNAKTNCTCCSLLTWDYTLPVFRHYIGPTRNDRKAGGVLIYNGRVLIIQSRSDKWGFPKGGFEQGETAIQCAKREVHEETSFDIGFNDDDPKVDFKDTTLYVKHLQNEPPEIDIQYLKTPGNDCTGIGWIRLSCLKKLVKMDEKCQTTRSDDYDIMKRLKTLSLYEEPSMQFNMGVRKFVRQYMGRSGRKTLNGN